MTTLITRVEVDREGPAFEHPTKPIGPVYSRTESERVAAEKGWVIAAGGGGIPVARSVAGSDLPGLHGVAAVIDKDLCTSLLVRELQADVLVIATDVPAVYLDWGQPTQRAIGKVTPQALTGHDFAAGSMGPKVGAARAFVLATGQRAVIGSLDRIEEMIAGTAGTQVCTEAAGGADTL